MITRFGDFAQSNQMVRLLTGAQTRARDIQAQLGSGKVAEQFGQLGVKTHQLLDAKTSVQQVRQFQADNQLVQSRLEVMESAIASVFDLGSRLKTLTIQRLSDGAAVPGTIAIEAELMLEQVASALNVDVDGRHLFAGSRIDTAPVDLDQASYYQGDQIALSAKIDVDLSITYGMTADREGFDQLIEAFRTVIDADPAGDRAQLEQALDLLNQALPKIADDRAEAGARHTQIERVNQIHTAAELYLEREISTIEDVDVAEAVTRLTQDQVALEAAMATIARLNQLSLTDFLR